MIFRSNFVWLVWVLILVNGEDFTHDMICLIALVSLAVSVILLTTLIMYPYVILFLCTRQVITVLLNVMHDFWQIPFQLLAVTEDDASAVMSLLNTC